jgi:hypothetical protein
MLSINIDKDTEVGKVIYNFSESDIYLKTKETKINANTIGSKLMDYFRQ